MDLPWFGGRNNMKRLFILLIMVSILSACSSTVKVENLSTPLESAKEFVKSLISSNIIQLNQVVYRSQSMPTDEIIKIAKMRNICGMKISQFTFKSDPNDKETVFVTFKDQTGEKDIWRLVFVQNPAKKYQYDGYLSGVLLANSTPIDLAKSYVKTIIQNDGYWLSNLTETRPQKLILDDYTKYNLTNKKLKDFSFSMLKGDSRVFIKIHYKNKWVNFDSIFAQKTNDGYYFN